MSFWRTATMDVAVDWDDVEKAREFEIREGREVQILTVPAEVDIDEALEQATVEQLRDALKQQGAEGYTQEQLAAIHDCFAALAGGDLNTASAMLNRIFEYPAQVAAAESGMDLFAQRRAA